MDELNYFQTFRFENVMNAAVTPSRKTVLVRAIEETIFAKWNGTWLCAVEVRRHAPWSRVRCHGCWLTHSQFNSRRHSLRITLKYTTLVRIIACALVSREPWNHDNGASDVWASTAYSLAVTGSIHVRGNHWLLGVRSNLPVWAPRRPRNSHIDPAIPC